MHFCIWMFHVFCRLCPSIFVSTLWMELLKENQTSKRKSCLLGCRLFCSHVKSQKANECTLPVSSSSQPRLRGVAVVALRPPFTLFARWRFCTNVVVKLSNWGFGCFEVIESLLPVFRQRWQTEVSFVCFFEVIVFNVIVFMPVHWFSLRLYASRGSSVLCWDMAWRWHECHLVETCLWDPRWRTVRQCAANSIQLQTRRRSLQGKVALGK